MYLFASFQENVVRLYTILREDLIPTGSVVQKLAYYLVQGLIARSSGSGAECCKSLAIPNVSVSFFCLSYPLKKETSAFMD